MPAFIRDTYTEAVNTSLAAHMPEIGGAYVQRNVSSGGTTRDARVTGGTGNLNTISGEFLFTNGATPPVTDYWVEDTWTPSAPSFFARCVNWTAEGTFYQLVIDRYSGEIRFERLSGWSPSTLGTPYVVSMPNGTPVTIRFELTVEGANKRLKAFVGGVERINVLDTSPLAGVGLTAPRMDGGDLSFTDSDTIGAAPPVITGPTGAAGAASITHAVNELQANAGTWSATGGSAWGLTGTDAGLLSISSGGVVTLASGNFDRETKASYSFNVLRDAVAQAVTLNINNVNEAPAFSGPDISVPGLVVGAAMSSINAALRFADPDSGDTGTYSAVGTWPAGITVSSAGLISGTPSAAGTSSNLRVRRTDGGALTADSNLFSITVSASSAPVAFTGTVGAQSGTVGSAFSWAGSALASFFSGSLTPFTYNVSAGSLPPGLTLNASTGVVSGTPTTAGTFNATFRALDTGSNAATSNSVAFTIAAAPAGLTLTAVATDATGSADYVSAPTRLIIEPLGNIENWGAGSRTISTTVTAANGEVTLPPLAPGRYSVLQIFPATGATVTGVALDIVTVP